jgi:hypothetical protein
MVGAPEIVLKRRSIYMTCTVYDVYFPGLQTIVLLRKADDLLLLPVRHAAAGGYLLKRHNAAGDRVVHAPDFFHEHGVGDDVEVNLPVVWRTESACLVAKETFRSQT